MSQVVGQNNPVASSWQPDAAEGFTAEGLAPDDPPGFRADPSSAGEWQPDR